MPFDTALRPLTDAQDYVISRSQAVDAGLSRRAIEYRLATGAWQVLLPGVYLVRPGRPSRSQAQVAALLYAGADAALDDVDACHAAGLTATPLVPGRVFVVVPENSAARSRGFAHIRRSRQPLQTLWVPGRRRILHLPDALVALSRRVRSDEHVLAAFSEAVQRRRVTLQQLVEAQAIGPPRMRAVADRALMDLGAGVLSAPEGRFRHLAANHPLLPPLHYNRRLQLPTGRIVVPDALALSAGLVHETNGRGPHEREDLFESMQERHDAMTTAGLVVLHNAPRRIRTNGVRVIGEFVECFLRYDGRGLPPGVTLLDD